MGFLKELFPSTLSGLIFIIYMALFINQGILVTLTKSENNKYNYNTTTAVLLTEVVKLFFAIIIYLKNQSIWQLYSEVCKNRKVFALYMVPALLYCMYNNLAFINLAAFDPTTYFLLLQFRVVVTGVVYQILFKRKLSQKQWFSLIILTVGCIIKQLPIPVKQNAPTVKVNDSEKTPLSLETYNPLLNLSLLLVQVFCSCFAGVYNEYLLKYQTGDSSNEGSNSKEVNLMVQNFFMYSDSILCNVFLLMIRKNSLSLSELSPQNLKQIFLQPLVLLVVINNAFCGIVTSVFLKKLNSILKTFASALELLFTAILCWIIFGISIDYMTMISIAIVSYAIYIYSQNPVPLIDTKPKNPNTEDEINLLKV